MSGDRLRDAVAALDRAVEDRPGKVYDDLAEAVRCLARLRQELIGEWRSDARGNSLDRVNAVLSLVVGGEYPLERLRRDRIRQAREELVTLLDDRR